MPHQHFQTGQSHLSQSFTYHVGNSAFKICTRDSANHHEEITAEDKEVEAILTGVPEAGEYVRQLS